MHGSVSAVMIIIRKLLKIWSFFVPSTELENRCIVAALPHAVGGKKKSWRDVLEDCGNKWIIVSQYDYEPFCLNQKINIYTYSLYLSFEKLIDSLRLGGC